MVESSRKGEVDSKFPVLAIVCFIFNAGKKLLALSSSLILLSQVFAITTRAATADR